MIYETLHKIYSKHRKKHRFNPDSKQMCCMWSTSNPPDILEGTEPISDIEDVFNIDISDEDALLLYDMDLDQAAKLLSEMKENTC